MSDRISPYDDTVSIEERVDEIVATKADVHIEMLGETNAFMRIGADRFAVFVESGRLYIAWREKD